MTEWPLGGAPESVELIEDVFRAPADEFEKSFWWGFEAIIPRFGVWLVNPKPVLLDADWLELVRWLVEVDKRPEPKPGWPNPECGVGVPDENDAFWLDDGGSDDAVDDVTIDDVIIDWLDPNEDGPVWIGFGASTFPKFWLADE